MSVVLTQPIVLLLGLISLLAIFSAVRTFAPQHTMPAGIVLGLAALAFIAENHAALFMLPFWSGLIAFAAILSALMIVIHPNPMVSVLFLIVNLFCIALFYLILEAQFLAALQIIVYAGAIMVLFVFVVMLLNMKAEEGLRLTGGAQCWGAILLGGLFVALMFHAIRHRGDRPYVDAEGFVAGFGSARALGDALFVRYPFAFEIASVLLIAAMVGAVVLAKRRLR